MKTDQKTPLAEIYIGSRYDEEYPAEVSVNPSLFPDNRAAYAMDLAKAFGLMMVELDGEDTAGRQKARLLKPQEIADRACDIAQAMWTTSETRGWLSEVPTLEERATYTAKRKAAKKEREEATEKERAERYAKKAS